MTISDKLGLSIIAGTMALCACTSPVDAGLIRLKSRTIDTTKAPAFAATIKADNSHVLLAFSTPVDASKLKALDLAGVKLLESVPDNAVSVYAPPGTDLSAVPDLVWVGSLDPADKVSAKMDKVAGDQKWAVVDFFPDVIDEQAVAAIEAVGGKLRKHPNLRQGSYLVYGNTNVVASLAKLDPVSFIFPASKALVAGEPVNFCPGCQTKIGETTSYVANYVGNGDGWDGSGLGAASLTYWFVNGTADLSGTTEQTEVIRGMTKWSEQVQVTFSAAGAANQNRSFDIKWATGDHGDGNPFDGSGNVLAHCFYPSPPNSETIAGDMHFDDAETWCIGSDFDLFSVAMHEAGHGLGLAHSPDPTAVMYPYYPFVANLGNDDIAGIRSLYASTTADGGGDAFEPDDSFGQAKTIALGTSQSHSIVPAADQDFVSFTIGSSAEVTIETSGASGDTRMWLYNASQTELEFDDDDGVGLFSRIERLEANSQTLPAGTYYVKVDEYGNNDKIAAYNISVSVHYISAGGDAYEPDNSPAQAKTISSGVPQAHSIVPAGDVDCVVFTLSTYSEVVIETSGASGDTRMWLYSSALSEVEFNDDGGVDRFSLIDRTQAEGNTLAPGTYYVYVNEYSDVTQIAAYNVSLTVTPVGAADDAYEQNDSRGAAWHAGFNWEGIWLSQLNGLGVQGDDDWYRIDVAAGRLNVLADCTFTHADGDVDVQLTDAAGNVLDGSYGVDDSEHLSATVPSAGIYYIYVFGGNAGNSYDLRWVGLDVITDSRISGHVTGDGNTPLQGIDVQAYRWNGSWWEWMKEWSITDANGDYTITGLPAGTYRVEFKDWMNGNYASEVYNNAPNLDSGTDILVPALTTVGGINASLAAASKISGRITDPNGITPLAGISADAYRWNGSWWEYVAWDDTDANGDYTIGGLPAGTYRVQFSDWSGGNYISEVYNNAPNLDSGADIVVPALTTVGGINASLAAASKISGRITGLDGTTPLQGIDAQAYRWDGLWWEYVSWDDTDANGDYTIGGLPAGSYRVEFNDWQDVYAFEVYNNALDLDSGVDIVVPALTTVGGINASLAAASGISGTVTGPDGLTPVQDIDVNAYRWNGSWWYYMGWDGTDANGEYTIGGLPAGTYRVEFYDWINDKYKSEVYDNAPNLDSGVDIVAPLATIVPGINASLRLKASLAWLLLLLGQ